MHIEPLVDHFQVFYQLHCSQGFYSFAQHPTAKKILLSPPKSFHEWKPKFFYIKAGVIPMKMTFRGAEDIEIETLKTPKMEIWYQDMKDVPSIELPGRALVAAGTSVALYVVAYKRENGKMTTVQKGANEEPWYHQIVKNFALPKDADLNVQPSTDVGELTNLGVGPESKKKKSAPAATAVPKKFDTLKASVLKEEKKKGTRLVSEPWCDYVVVSDTLEGLASVAVRKPKPEPRDTADILVANPEDPIDLESSPEPLLRTKAVKRKQLEGEVGVQPAKRITRKKISKKERPVPSVCAESSSVFNDDLPPSAPCASIKEQLEGTKTVEAEVKKTVEVEKPIEVDVELEKTGFIAHDEEEDSLIRPDETPGDYYYRTYSVKRASEIHAPMWKIKQGDTFSDWKVCRDWLQGIFPPAEIKFQEEQSHECTYHSYLKEIASSTSTTHRIVCEWRSRHKELAAFETSKKEGAEEKAKVAVLRAKFEADQAKFEGEQKIEEWFAMGWKNKAEAEEGGGRSCDEARSHREQSEKRELQTCATLALKNKEIEELTSLLTDQEQTKAELESAKKDLQLERVEKAEAACRLAETEEKLESSETARVTVESLVEPLKNDMLWMQHHGIINVANLMVTAHNDGYTQGYTECTQHVTDALRVDWDTSRSAMRGVDTSVAHAAAKAEYNNLHLPMMDLVTIALQYEDFVSQLKEILPDEGDASDKEDLE
ncbi:hypothetical protein Hanom_Chr09g00810931 [Helianthus anomalus]